MYHSTRLGLARRHRGGPDPHQAPPRRTNAPSNSPANGNRNPASPLAGVVPALCSYGPRTLCNASIVASFGHSAP